MNKTNNHLARRWKQCALGIAAVVALLAQVAPSQTRIGLRDQAKEVDFRTAAFTRPVRTGSSLPANCQTGELFFLLSAPAGSNLYGCSALDIWVVQSGGSTGAGSLTHSVEFTAASSVTLTNAEHGLNTSDLAVMCLDNAEPANELLRSGLKIGNDHTVEITFAAPATGRCLLIGPARPYETGEGLVQNGNELSADPAVIPAYLTSGLHALAAFSVAAGECEEKNLPLLGSGLGDAVIGRWPANLPAGLAGTMFVAQPGQVRLRLCNMTAATVSVPASDFGATILRLL